MRGAAIAATLILALGLITAAMVRADTETPSVILPPPDGPLDHAPGPNWLHAPAQVLK